MAIAENLLDEFDAEPRDEILPDGTHVFQAALRYPPAFWYSAWGGAALGILLISVGAASSGGARAGLLVVGCLAMVGACAYCVYLAYLARDEHSRRLQNGEFQEGVLVFKSGDVVVRYQQLLSLLDMTIENMYLSRADVEVQFSPTSCGSIDTLNICFVDVNARPQVLSIPCVDLLDDVQEIADFINDAKQQNLLASMKMGQDRRGVRAAALATAQQLRLSH